MPKPPVFESVWTNKAPDPDTQERWDEMLNSRRPKSPADIEAARAYAKEFAVFAPRIASVMRQNLSFRIFRSRKVKVVVSKLVEGWWKAEFYRWKTEAERSRTSAIFEPYAFTLEDAPRTPAAAEGAPFTPLPTELWACVREIQRRRLASERAPSAGL
jgi:hypothetical protein